MLAWSNNICHQDHLVAHSRMAGVEPADQVVAADQHPLPGWSKRFEQEQDVFTSSSRLQIIPVATTSMPSLQFHHRAPHAGSTTRLGARDSPSQTARSPGGIRVQTSRRPPSSRRAHPRTAQS